MTKREKFIQWLADAHAMVVGIVSTLEKHIADAMGQPKVRAALSKHLQETKRHATEMKKALEAIGGSHPVLKEGVSKLVNLAAGLVTTAAKDTVIKNAIADFATEHFEIACYSFLIESATALGESAIVRTCKAILKEEQAMARLLESQVKAVHSAYFAELEDDAEAAPTERPKKRSGGREQSPSKTKARKKSSARAK
jgi:ferritin-like metal-binding protein YciE